jgi:hypothetical protein
MDHARACQERMRGAAAYGNESHAFFEAIVELGAGAGDRDT